MDEKIVVSPEEAKAEQEALAEAKVEEIKSRIIEEFGFDETNDSERIDKLVEKEINHRKSLSQAIGQKVKYRTGLQALQAVPPPKEDKTISPEEIDKKLDEKLNERLEKRDLESLEYPKELKENIQKVAKTLGVSIKAALTDPYIVFQIGEYEKAQEAEEAAVSRTNKTGRRSTPSLENPPKDIDMSTEEGRKKWDEHLAAVRKQGL